MNQRLQTQKDERGLVSFIVTTIIMILLSLIVISFAQIIRREQRQTLDRQLNTQAFYAAESGINDAVHYLEANPGFSQLNCGGVPGYNSQLDSAGTISYSCVLVDPTATSLKYDNIDTTESRVVPVIPVSSINTIYISWQENPLPPPPGGPNFSGCRSNAPPNASLFPPQGSWGSCSPGVLRVDLVPINGTFDRNALAQQAMTAFLYPIKTGGTPTAVPYNGSNGFGGQGIIKGVRCDNPASPPTLTPNNCKAQINLGAVAGTGRYYLRLKSIYKSNSVTITATNGGGAIALTGAQATIDVTGKANDILKRIQVRVPITSLHGPFPEFPAQSLGSLCKRLGIAPSDHIDGFDPATGSDQACHDSFVGY